MGSRVLFEFRAAVPEDAAAIRDLVREAYAKWVPVIGREPLPMQADYERAVREHDFSLMFSGSRMIGLIETMLTPDHLWIENVAVAPAEQGNGFGRQLLARAESEALAAGSSEMRLMTNAAFVANIFLYERMGYLITQREPFMGGTTVRMSKKLRA